MPDELILGATSPTYTLTSLDVGRNIYCKVTATNVVGHTEVNAIQVGPITAAPPVGTAPTNAVLPVLSNTNPVVGISLSCNTGTWIGTAPISYTYQWKRAPNTAIPGATANDYVPVAGDIGFFLLCTVTANNAFGVVSASTLVSTAVVPLAVVPTNTALPVIDDSTPLVGETLHCSTGAWSGSPTSFTYQWFHGVGLPIPAATSSSYLVLATDDGTSLFCQVTAINSAGSASADAVTVGPVGFAPLNTVAPEVIELTPEEGETLTTSDGTWAGTAPITFTYQWYQRIAEAPAIDVAPVVSGSLTVGQVLHCTTGTWNGDTPILYDYQWQRGATPIGINSADYSTVLADIGASIHCTVTATNAVGFDSADSNTVGLIVEATGPPINVTAPLAASVSVAGSVISCDEGIWSGTAPITHVYQWFHSITVTTISLLLDEDGNPLVDEDGNQLTFEEIDFMDVIIPGANASSYMLQLTDVGNAVYCLVTAHNAFGDTSEPSNLVGPVTAPVVSYVGPGDIVTGAYAWYGLRAYNGDYTVGLHPAIDVVDDATGLITTTINILADGSLDVAAIAALGYPVRVSKMYDQVASGGIPRDIVQATHADRPGLLLNAVGTRPAMVFDEHHRLSSGPVDFSTGNTSLTYSSVMRVTATDSNLQYTITPTAGPVVLMDGGSGVGSPTCGPYMYAGTFVAITTHPPTNDWLALQNVFNGAASDFNIDGTSLIVNPGTMNNLPSVAFAIGAGSGTSSGLRGNITEVGLWLDIPFSSSQSIAMSANQHAWWS
jgi:hypothetical protein